MKMHENLRRNACHIIISILSSVFTSCIFTFRNFDCPTSWRPAFALSRAKSLWLWKTRHKLRIAPAAGIYYMTMTDVASRATWTRPRRALFTSAEAHPTKSTWRGLMRLNYVRHGLDHQEVYGV